jgi:hypothetical protein
VSAVNIDLCRYGWIHLLPAIVKEDSVSRQSSIDLCWKILPIIINKIIHLLSAIVKDDSVSRKSSIDLCRIHLPSAIVREDSVSHQSSINLRLDSLTSCNSKGRACQPSV